MNDNIYIKTLEIGMMNHEGISFNEVVEKLKIDFVDINQEVNYTIWFYSNFYNTSVEDLIVGQVTASNRDYRINSGNIKRKVKPYNNQKSYIKGHAVNKYIDFLELERTRKSSQLAKIFSIFSILIAITAIIVPIYVNKYPKPPYKVIITQPTNSFSNFVPTNQSDDTTSFTNKDSVKIIDK